MGRYKASKKIIVGKFVPLAVAEIFEKPSCQVSPKLNLGAALDGHLTPFWVTKNPKKFFQYIFIYKNLVQSDVSRR